MKKILIIGGGGYCGSVLVPTLLEQGWIVTIYDIFDWYGYDHLPLENKNLKIISGDVRDIEKVRLACQGQEFLLHLACISNDSSFELDEDLSTSVNFLSFEPIVIAAKESGIKRFVFASSSSVYGVSDEPNVKEDHKLLPLTLYNKYKGLCEPLLLKHTDPNFIGVVFRPATVCGYGPRQRLDLSVNILTNFAVNNKKILVFGGNQLRPNLHIKDYCRVCTILLEAEKSLVQNEVFNCGSENLSIMDIAKKVKLVVEREFPENGLIPIEKTETDDLRSYHINSDKIYERLGFKTNFTVNDAINDLCKAFKSGLLPESFSSDKYYNVRTMKKLEIK